MKRESEIINEINRLKNCISLRKDYINSIYTDEESKVIYEYDIREIENDIKRLVWVLED